MDIHPYDSVKECVKCGSSKWPRPYSFSVKFLDKHNTKLYNSEVGCESMLSTCGNCGYQWLEHTKDYVEPKAIDFSQAPIMGNYLPRPKEITLNKIAKKSKELTIEEQADKEVSEICTVLMVDEKPVLVRPRKWYEFL